MSSSRPERRAEWQADGGPLPAPPRADSVLERARALTDHTDALSRVSALVLEERAAHLTAVYDELASTLREAEG